MSEIEAVARLLRASSDEFARLWLEVHVGVGLMEADRDAVSRAPGRSASLLAGLARAMSAESPTDWGGFSHREAVQIATMMAWSLAEGGATPAAGASLFPCLVIALEGLGLSRVCLLYTSDAADESSRV